MRHPDGLILRQIPIMEAASRDLDGSARTQKADHDQGRSISPRKQATRCRASFAAF